FDVCWVGDRKDTDFPVLSLPDPITSVTVGDRQTFARGGAAEALRGDEPDDLPRCPANWPHEWRDARDPDQRGAPAANAAGRSGSLVGSLGLSGPIPATRRAGRAVAPPPQLVSGRRSASGREAGKGTDTLALAECVRESESGRDYAG